MKFTKMHGLGNDYIFVDALEERIPEEELPALAREISHRHFGVGADGLILILFSAEADFRMRVFNADGSEAEMCGNGIRCFAKYVYDRGLTRKTDIRVETLAGMISPHLTVEGGEVTAVRVDMGEPRLKRKDIPMAGPPEDRVLEEPLKVGREEFRVTCVSMGNPHCIIFVDEIWAVDLDRLGPLIERHPVFPERTNVEFVRVHDPGEITMRVWERGSGITLACGTGACASVVAGNLLGRVGREATVHLPGGDLLVEWASDNHVYMTGPAVTVCEGQYYPRPRAEVEKEKERERGRGKG